MTNLQIENISVDELKTIITESVKEQLKVVEKTKEASPEYGTRAQVKDRLHVSYPTLNELTKTGKLKGYKIGGRVLYKWNEVEEALTAIETKIV